MYKIKLEENENVNIYFNIEFGKFNQVIVYKVNLNSKQYSCFESGEEIFLDWEEIECEIKKQFGDIKNSIVEKIINNKKVIFSYKKLGDENGVKKANNHLQKNEKILNYLNNYKF